MRSCLSLLLMLVVIAAILAGGYWIYQQQASKDETTLTLNNKTSFGLTVNMKGPLVVRFAIMPGKSQTQKVAPGDYEVDGALSDPKTDGFQSKWSFQRGGTYNADFTRSGSGGGGTAQLVLASSLQQSQ